MSGYGQRHAGSPFCNAALRRSMGLVCLTEVRILAKVSTARAAVADRRGLLPEPALVSASGKKRLWRLADIEAFLAEGGLDGVCAYVQKGGLAHPCEGSHLRLAQAFYRGQAMR